LGASGVELEKGHMVMEVWGLSIQCAMYGQRLMGALGLKTLKTKAQFEQGAVSWTLEGY
jgi:hypothetical protein